MGEPGDREIDDAERALLDDLESVSSMLVPPKDPPPARGDSEIPVLLDVVEIPVLEAATGPHPTGHAAGSTEGDGEAGGGGPTAAPRDADVCAASGSDQTALHEALQTEAATILEDLLDEFIPRIEARFRQRLEARSRALIESAASTTKPGC